MGDNFWAGRAEVAREYNELQVAMDTAWLLFDRPAWHAQAACLGMSHVDYDLFFPGQGRDTGEAKSVCHGCPVRAECEEASLDEKFGIWGGLSERQRRRLRRGAKVVEGLPGRPKTRKHGDRACYQRDNCRCDLCVAAEREYRNEYNAANRLQSRWWE